MQNKNWNKPFILGYSSYFIIGLDELVILLPPTPTDQGASYPVSTLP